MLNPLSIPGTEPPDDDGIVKAGRLIAGVDDPPDWLLSVLVLHSRAVGGDRVSGEDEKKIDETLWRARRNIDQLTTFLKKFLPDLTSCLMKSWPSTSCSPSKSFLGSRQPSRRSFHRRLTGAAARDQTSALVSALALWSMAGALPGGKSLTLARMFVMLAKLTGELAATMTLTVAGIGDVMSDAPSPRAAIANFLNGKPPNPQAHPRR